VCKGSSYFLWQISQNGKCSFASLAAKHEAESKEARLHGSMETIDYGGPSSLQCKQTLLSCCRRLALDFQLSRLPLCHDAHQQCLSCACAPSDSNIGQRGRDTSTVAPAPAGTAELVQLGACGIVCFRAMATPSTHVRLHSDQERFRCCSDGGLLSRQESRRKSGSAQVAMRMMRAVVALQCDTNSRSASVKSHAIRMPSTGKSMDHVS
jgi:hypothetical protein